MSSDGKRKRTDDEDDPWPGRFFPLGRDSFFGDFGGLDREFKRIMEYFDEVMRRDFDEDGTLDAHGPFVYGISYKVGPDGKPKFERFGNAPPILGQMPGRGTVAGAGGAGHPHHPFDAQERTPLTDVIECQDSVSITVEIPGVEKEDIELNVEEDKTTIHVDSDDRKYFKEVPLPAKVVPDSAKATYKNGVLDITLMKVVPKKKRAKTVKID